jgi:ubiquinone/menaquinone biosynthesis C-methylase UbiE
MSWQECQEQYLHWCRQPLDPAYLRTIRALGLRFLSFIREGLGVCVDLGCGCGIYGGKTYAESNYFYLMRYQADRIIGVDPLKLEAPIPWLTDFVQGRSEELPLKSGSCDTIVMATSLEHLENPEAALRECYRILKAYGVLNLWTVVYDKKESDQSHTQLYTLEELLLLLWRSEFVVMKVHVEKPALFRDDTQSMFLKLMKMTLRSEKFG